MLQAPTAKRMASGIQRPGLRKFRASVLRALRFRVVGQYRLSSDVPLQPGLPFRQPFEPNRRGDAGQLDQQIAGGSGRQPYCNLAEKSGHASFNFPAALRKPKGVEMTLQTRCPG